MYIKQDIENVSELRESRSRHGRKHTTVCWFPVSISDGQQEFTDLNTVCDAVKQTEPSGIHFREVDATWTKLMNYETNMMDKALEVRIVSDGKVARSCVEDMMQKLEDHMQEHMKGYPEWDRATEGPKPSHACIHYEKENNLEKAGSSVNAESEDSFAAAVESIPVDDKGLEQ